MESLKTETKVWTTLCVLDQGMDRSVLDSLYEQKWNDKFSWLKQEFYDYVLKDIFRFIILEILTVFN